MNSKSLRFLNKMVAAIVLASFLFIGTSVNAQSITISPWEMHYGGGIINLNFTFPSHGHSSAYAYANIPTENHSAWQAAPVDGNGAISFTPSSVLSRCRSQLDFTYFQTNVYLPLGTNLTSLTASFSVVDDGARAYIFNSTYPNGSYVPGADMRGGNNASANLASRAVVGEVNRIVIVQFDDCPTGNNLRGANINVNGNVVPQSSCTSYPAPSSPAVHGFAGRTVTFSNVSLNSGGNSIAVSAGANVNIRFNWSSAYTSSYCPGCIQQFYYGIAGQTATCIYSGNTSSTRSGSINANWTAPSTAGWYYVTTSSGLGYRCGSRTAAPCGGNIAIIKVGNPAAPSLSISSSTNPTCPSSTDGSINSSLSNAGGFSYSYSWTGPNSYTATTANISGLAAGTYTLTATNNCNSSCVLFETVTLTAVDNTAPSISCAADVSVNAGASTSGSSSVNVPGLAQYVFRSTHYTYWFNDPLPSGATVTGVSMSNRVYYPYGCCVAENILQLSYTTFARQYPQAPAGYKTFNHNYTGSVPSYNYGGSNWFRIWSNWNAIRWYGGTLTIHYTINGESCSAEVSLTAPTASDNCGTPTITNNFNNTSSVTNATFPVGTTNVVWTATDAAGNTSTCTQKVTVTDITAPTVSCPADVSVNSPAVVIDSASTYVGSGGSICCWQTLNKTFSDPLPSGATVVGAAITFTARDQGWGGTGANAHVYIAGTHIGGRPIYHGTTTGTVSQMVDIPSYNYGGSNTLSVTHVGWPGWRFYWMGGTIKLYYKTADGCVQYVTIGSPTASDSCGVASMVNDYNNTSNASGDYPLGTTTVTWTITDVNGNASTCTQDVTVTDVTAPTISGCPSDIAVTAQPNDCSPAVSWTEPTATDNCDVTASSTHSPGDNFNIGTTTVTYTFTDGSGNSSTCSFDVVITATPLVTSTSTSSYSCGYGVSCNGASDGSATASTSGGCLPYSWAWSDGQTSATATGLSAGSYTVTATDAKGTTSTASVTISEPALVSSSLTAATYSCGYNVSCAGESDGSITNSVSGGCAPYTYSWSNGATTKDVSSLSAGTYGVTVTDANGCTATSSVTLTEPAVVAASLSMSVYSCGYNVSCNGASDGTAMVATLSGGCAPYSYAWSDGQTTKDASGLTAGTYSVTITDQNGCTWTGSTTLTEPALFTGSTSSPVYNCGYNVSCNGLSDGSATVSMSGGCMPYTYLWTDGQTSATASNLPAGTHTVTATDANGCSYTESITLTEPDLLVTTVTPQDTIIDCVPSDWDITSSTVGGCAPYLYAWDDTGSTVTSHITINPNVSTTYTLTVTDDNGCVAVDSSEVTVINRCGNNDRKSLICHVPSGNKQNPQTICISPNALKPHLGSMGDLHGGDYCGPCTNKALRDFADGAEDADPSAVYVKAYPNPFTNVTTIEFSIASSSDVKIEVFSLTGAQVATLFNGYMEGGSVNAIEFAAENLPNGVYIYKLTTASSTTYDKVTLVK